MNKRILELRSALLLALILLAGHAAAWGQAEPAESDIDLVALEEKADEVVKVNLWGRSLDQAKKLVGLRKNVTSSMKSFMHGLTAVYRRTYRFRHGRASRDDVEPMHRKLAEEGWVPMIETENRDTPESLSVYSYYEDEQVAGMTVVSSHPDEVTVLKIMGPVDFEALSAIGSDWGVPIMNIGSTDVKTIEGAAPGQ